MKGISSAALTADAERERRGRFRRDKVTGVGCRERGCRGEGCRGGAQHEGGEGGGGQRKEGAGRDGW